MTITLRNELPQRCFTIPHVRRLRPPTPSLLSNWNSARSEPMRDGILSASVDHAERDGHGSGGNVVAQMEKIGWLQSYPARVLVFEHGDSATSVFICATGQTETFAHFM